MTPPRCRLCLIVSLFAPLAMVCTTACQHQEAGGAPQAGPPAAIADRYNPAPDADGKLFCNIAYGLAPITVDVVAAGPGDLSYHVFDASKHEIAQGKLEPGVKTSVTFTPPKYGWYAIEYGTYENDHMTSGAARFIGVTPRYPMLHALAAGEVGRGWNNEPLQSFCGLLLDRTNTRMGFAHLEKVLAAAEANGVTLVVQFESAPTIAQVQEAVTRFKGRVKFWEIVNEPNFSTNPQAYAALVAKVYPAIKQIDPQATVMGCDTCGIQLGWYDAFYKAGGGKSLDVISIHDYEGNEAIDPWHWNYKLAHLRAIMAGYGDADKPIWQTERAISGVRLGYIGAAQALRISLQRDILEAWGVTNNHNNHYYADVTGYDSVPTFVFSSTGPFQAALVCRTRAAMIAGRSFAGKIDFGPTGNKIFLGLRYRGDDGQTITLRNYGCLDAPVTLHVTGGHPLWVVDAFGNVQAVPVSNGKATVTVSQRPSYLMLDKGQDVTVDKWDFGPDIAAEATFDYSGGSKSNPKILTDGQFQDTYPGNVLGGGPWTGGYTGATFNDKPETFDIVFPAVRPVSALILYGVRADNPFSAILDYDLQYNNAGQWVTLEEVRTPCPPSDVVQTYLCKTISWFGDNNFFVHRFKQPIQTDKLRLIVRRITRGCLTDMIVEDAINVGKPAAKRWKATGNWLQFREIEVYGPPSP